MTARWTSVSGWGGTPAARSEVHAGSTPNAVRGALLSVNDRGLIPRGLGRSYGDAAQRSGGAVVAMDGAGGVRWHDDIAGVVEAAAGATIADLITFGEPFGWFPPVTPGTRFVTVGGAIAADIHGKNHHVAGSFGDHLVSIELMRSDGEVVVIDPVSDPVLFWATVGGLGLTGVVLSAQIRMIGVPGTRMAVTAYRTRDLEATMAAMEAADESFDYTVSWIDLMATGSSLGRGVVTNGDHIAESGPALSDLAISVPGWWRHNLVHPAGIRVFNELWFRRAPARPSEGVESYGAFFYPLDGVRQWNRLYGSRGFLQYQFVLPFEFEDRLPLIVERIAEAQLPVFLAVLKRFGPQGKGMISFPRAGWTLALDLPAPRLGSSVSRLLDELDDELAEIGGRIYLAKDSRMAARHLEAMNPRLEEFRAALTEFDPSGRFESDLSARLGITSSAA
ncbi:MAG: FAD-binding oxidoreductase [Ilumatobacter sp.]|nr:FAD-binding oxidoreductase [Ilumatobacter sp.]